MKEDNDLLAMLAMIVPSLLLIVLVALSLLSGGAMPQQDGGMVQGDGDKAPQAQALLWDALAAPDASLPPEPSVATQKRMRDPWSHFPSAGTLKASSK